MKMIIFSILFTFILLFDERSLMVAFGEVEYNYDYQDSKSPIKGFHDKRRGWGKRINSQNLFNSHISSDSEDVKQIGNESQGQEKGFENSGKLWYLQDCQESSCSNVPKRRGWGKRMIKPLLKRRGWGKRFED